MSRDKSVGAIAADSGADMITGASRTTSANADRQSRYRSRQGTFLPIPRTLKIRLQARERPRENCSRNGSKRRRGHDPKPQGEDKNVQEVDVVVMVSLNSKQALI